MLPKMQLVDCLQNDLDLFQKGVTMTEIADHLENFATRSRIGFESSPSGDPGYVLRKN